MHGLGAGVGCRADLAQGYLSPRGALHAWPRPKVSCEARTEPQPGLLNCSAIPAKQRLRDGRAQRALHSRLAVRPRGNTMGIINRREALSMTLLATLAIIAPATG